MCSSLRCDFGVCAQPNCQDRVRNGFETGTDCGGPCGGCITRSFCYTGHDCQSGHCVGSGATRQCAPSRCDDSIANGDETDTDCGGNCFGRCPNGFKCSQGFECTSGRCLGNDKLGNTRYCAPVRLFNLAGKAAFSSIVRGGFDVRGKHKASLIMDVFRRELASFLNLAIEQVSTDSITDVQAARSFGERSPNVTLPLNSDGLEISKSTDTVAAARYRFDLYVQPYEVELYQERVRWLERLYVDVDASGNIIGRGVDGVKTLFQAGDSDAFEQAAAQSAATARLLTPARAPRAALSTNQTSAQGTSVPSLPGVRRLYLNDALQRGGINNTGVVNVDPAQTTGTAASRLYLPHHIVVQRQPNGSATSLIENGVDFPVQPIVYVADRHGRRIRLYDKKTFLRVSIDEQKFPPGTANARGEYVELFGESTVELTYISGGRAFFSGLSISAPVPEGLRLRFAFETSDPAWESLSLPVVESTTFVVTRKYVPPKVIVPRVPFPPALVVAMCLASVAAIAGTAHFGVKWYRARKQERHVVPTKAPAGVVRAKAGAVTFGDTEGMAAHVDELQKGYIDPVDEARAKQIASSARHADEPDEEYGLQRSKSAIIRQIQRHAGAHADDTVASTRAAASALGNADTARAFDLLRLEMGQPVPVGRLPPAMQRLHKHGMLNVPNVVQDDPAEVQKGSLSRHGTGRKSWRESWFGGMSRILSSRSLKEDSADGEDAADAKRGPDGLIDVEVASHAPEAARAEQFMNRRPARTVGESLHMAKRTARRSASAVAMTLGMAGTAASLFPPEERRAYLEGKSPEEVLREQEQQMEAMGGHTDGKAAPAGPAGASLDAAVGLGTGAAEGEPKAPPGQT